MNLAIIIFSRHTIHVTNGTDIFHMRFVNLTETFQSSISNSHTVDFDETLKICRIVKNI